MDIDAAALVVPEGVTRLLQGRATCDEFRR